VQRIVGYMQNNIIINKTCFTSWFCSRTVIGGTRSLDSQCHDVSRFNRSLCFNCEDRVLVWKQNREVCICMCKF